MSSNKLIPKKKKKKKFFSIHFDILFKTTCTRPKKKSLIACTSVCNEANSLYYFLVSSKIYCFKILLQKKVLQNSNGHLSTTKGPPKFSTQKEKEKKAQLVGLIKRAIKITYYIHFYWANGDTFVLFYVSSAQNSITCIYRATNI